MRAMQERFIGLFVVVSGLAALAAWLLIRGASGGGPLVVGLGVLMAVVALLGTVVLARFVIVAERERRAEQIMLGLPQAVWHRPIAISSGCSAGAGRCGGGWGV